MNLLWNGRIVLSIRITLYMEKHEITNNIVALDVGGSLVKLAYTAPHPEFKEVSCDGIEKQPEGYDKRSTTLSSY